MPFIGELVSLHYKENPSSAEIQILDAHAIEYRPLRHIRDIGTTGGVFYPGPIRPLHPSCAGAIYHRDPETAEQLFDLYTYNTDSDVRLIARYRQNNVLRYKMFKGVIFGAGNLALWNTSREEGWTGRSPLVITPFMLAMASNDVLGYYIETGDVP